MSDTSIFQTSTGTSQVSGLAIGETHPLHRELPDFGLSVFCYSASGTIMTVTYPSISVGMASAFAVDPLRVGVVPMEGGCLWLLATRRGGLQWSVGSMTFDTAWRPGPTGGNYLPGYPPMHEGFPKDVAGLPARITLVLSDEAHIVKAIRPITLSVGFQRVISRVYTTASRCTRLDEADWAALTVKTRDSLDAGDMFLGARAREWV